MIRMFVRHSVSDFEKWKQSYDAFHEARQGLGVEGAAVFKGAPDANEVTVWHDFASIDVAKAFLESEELASTMKEAGVLSEPQVWFAERDLPA